MKLNIIIALLVVNLAATGLLMYDSKLIKDKVRKTHLNTLYLSKDLEILSDNTERAFKHYLE
jgi:hypothetical protein